MFTRQVVPLIGFWLEVALGDLGTLWGKERTTHSDRPQPRSYRHKSKINGALTCFKVQRVTRFSRCCGRARLVLAYGRSTCRMVMPKSVVYPGEPNEGGDPVTGIISTLLNSKNRQRWDLVSLPSGSQSLWFLLSPNLTPRQRFPHVARFNSAAFTG